MSSDLKSKFHQNNLNRVKPSDTRIYGFGDFRFDAGHLMLYRHGEEVSLTPKQAETLLALIEQHGEIVSKEALMERLWGDAAVEESNLIQNIYVLRKVLGDNHHGHPMIETLRRRGYRFNAELSDHKHRQPEVSAQIALDELDLARANGTEGSTFRTREDRAKAEKTISSPSFAPAKGRIRIFIGGAILIAVLGGVYFLWTIFRPPPPITSIALKALTSSGKITFSAISPDGRFFAFVKTQGGKPSLWVRQVSLRTSEIQLTEQKQDEVFNGVSISPDGAKVYFLLKPRNNSVKQLYSIPVFGGEPAKAVVSDVDSTPAFAPDGKYFAFMRRDAKQGVTALLIADADGSNVRELTSSRAPGEFMLKPLAWSPDGKTIACFMAEQAGSAERHLVKLDAATGDKRYVSEQTWIGVDSVVWANNDELIYSASDSQKPVGLRLWSMSGTPGTARRLSSDLSDYTDLSVAADTREIAAIQSEWQSYVLLTNVGSPEMSQKISLEKSDGSQGIAWTPDGNLIYTSIINGRNSLQRLSIPDRSVTAITADDKYVFRNPIVTPDGRFVVYSSNQNDPEGIWRMTIDGLDPRRLVSISSDLAASSPDGRMIYFSSSFGGNSLWKVSIDGGEAYRLSDKMGLRPKVSPDGKRIAFYYRSDSKAPWQIAIISTEEDRILQIIDLPKTVPLNSQFTWSTDGQALILIDSRDIVNNLWRYPVDGQPATQITKLADDSFTRIVNFSFSPDGKQIAVTRGRTFSDAVLLNSATH